ncbi:MAG TPA: hypothetical protein VEV17_13385 [Bryobacteraceae bacterium]|nr:hypothetical protein [Bryobacteraceae bacterium]
MKRVSPYLWLLSLFAVSRLCYFVLGVRFDARPILHFYQLIDKELLEKRLWESLLYLHVQPPGFNLYAGIVLKFFPDSYAVIFHLVHLAAGAAICCLTYHLMRVCGVSRGVAFVLAGLFIVSPGVVLFENFLLYEYLVAFALLVAAAALHRFMAAATLGSAACFFGSLLALVLLRNIFHLVYYLAAVLFLLWFRKENQKAVVLGAIVPLLLILGLYAKNWILFGTFSSSTWTWAALQAVTSHNLTPLEAEDLEKRGVISPVSLVRLGAPIRLYRPYIKMPARTGIAVLDQEASATGIPNFNNPAFLAIGRQSTRDSRAILRQYPAAYFRAVQIAWFSYFLPPGDSPFFDLNRPKIHALDRLFNLALFGQMREAPDRSALRTLKATGTSLGLVLYTGIFLLIGLPLVWLWSIYYLATGIRQRTLPAPIAVLIGFLIFNITYVTALANFLSSFENNRYRFPLDSFFVVLLGVAAERIRRKFPRPLDRYRAVRMFSRSSPSTCAVNSSLA